MITVVAGFARSGTSLMMRMLHKGGMEVYADNHYSYETEDIHRLPRDTQWLDQAEGKAIKILEPLEFYPPRDRKYRFLFMVRTPTEQARSQIKFLNTVMPGVVRGNDKSNLRKMTASLKRDTPRGLKKLSNYPGSQLLKISFERLIDAPGEIATSLAEFCGGLDPTAMAAQVVKRNSDCLPYMLEANLI